MSSEQPEKCELTGIWSWLAQLTLLIVAAISICVSRLVAKNPRPLKIWGFDVLKQALGAVYCHFFQFFLSLFLTTPTTDGCIWFLANYNESIILGVFISYIVRLQVDKIADKNPDKFRWMKTGNYGNPPSCKIMWMQVCIWMVIVTVGQIGCVLFITVFKVPMLIIHEWITYPLRGHPMASAFIIMGIYPIIMSSVTFVVQDKLLSLIKDDSQTEEQEQEEDAAKVMHSHNSNHISTSLPDFASHQQNAVVSNFNISADPKDYQQIYSILQIPCNKSGGYDIAMYYSSVIGYVDINTSTSVIIRGAYSYRTLWESYPDEYQILHLSFGILTLENIEFQFSETRTTI
ncbi:MAG: hypothetical protein EZS28_031634, partial [Streblomastix strix]